MNNTNQNPPPSTTPTTMPRPPFDPELAPILASLPPQFTATLTPSILPALAASLSGTQTPSEFLASQNYDHVLQATEHTILGHLDQPIRVIVITRRHRLPVQSSSSSSPPSPPLSAASSSEPISPTSSTGSHGNQTEPVSPTTTTAAASNSPSKRPSIFFIHGGGFLMGSALQGTEPFLHFVESHDAVLATIDYRLAPQFTDPFQREDCYAGLKWFSSSSSVLGSDKDRGVMIIGNSAGGGLAAGLGLMVRDREEKEIKIGSILLQAPMLDDRDETISTKQFEPSSGKTIWNAASNRTAWGAYLPSSSEQPVSIYAAPSRAADTTGGLRGLPPTYIEVGSCEVFRDEATQFALGLWRDGGRCDLRVYDGGYHAFGAWDGISRLAKEARESREAWIRRMFKEGEGSGGKKVEVEGNLGPSWGEKREK